MNYYCFELIFIISELGMKNQLPPTSEHVIESVWWRFLKTSKVTIKKSVNIYTIHVVSYLVIFLSYVTLLTRYLILILSTIHINTITLYSIRIIFPINIDHPTLYVLFSWMSSLQLEFKKLQMHRGMIAIESMFNLNKSHNEGMPQLNGNTGKSWVLLGKPRGKGCSLETWDQVVWWPHRWVRQPSHQWFNDTNDKREP